MTDTNREKEMTSKIVRLRTHTVGAHFGTAAQLLGTGGRTIYQSETKPYGFVAAAIADARNYAAEQGWTIANDIEYTRASAASSRNRASNRTTG